MRRIALADYGTPPRLVWQDLDRADPGPGIVAVRVEAVGLNPIDAKIARGDMAAMMPLPLPAPIASDLAGVVIAVGEGVTDVAVGDPVLGMVGGALGDTVLTPSGTLTRRPASVPVTAAAVASMVGLTSATILRNLHSTGGHTGEHALVIGASGGIGRFLLPQLRDLGFVVTATGAPADEARLHRAGAAIVLDYRGGDLPSQLHAIRPQGFDLVIDMVNQLGDLLTSAALVRAGGQLVSTLFGPEPEHFGRELTVTYIRNEPDRAALAQVAQLLADGIVELEADHVVDASDAIDAFADYATARLTGKVAIRFASP